MGDLAMALPDPNFGSFDVFAKTRRWIVKGSQVSLYRVWCLDGGDGDGFTIYPNAEGKDGVSVRTGESVDVAAKDMYVIADYRCKGVYQFLK